MEKGKFALFLIVNEEMDIREMHLMCNEGEVEDAWRGILAAVFTQALEECPDIFEEVVGKEYNYES